MFHVPVFYGGGGGEGVSACLGWDGGRFTDLAGFLWLVSLRGTTLGNLGLWKRLIISVMI